MTKSHPLVLGWKLKKLRFRTSHCDTDTYTAHTMCVCVYIVLLYDVGPLTSFTPLASAESISLHKLHAPHARVIIFCSFLRSFWNKRSLKRSFDNALIIARLPIRDNLAMRSVMDFAKLLGKIKTRISATNHE